MHRVLCVFVATFALISHFGCLAGHCSDGELAKGEGGRLSTEFVREISLRSIGPALKPGRIADIAIDPRNRSVWYLATAIGGLWKTTTRGISWRPIFDEGGSYSLGCVALDPNDPDVVWLGTGENSSNRSVGYGDGIYRSGDGGETWEHMGLDDSQHIGKILIDPRNSNVLFAASQGPLWSPGGDRGLYKTTDGGRTWKAVLEISENTGVTDIAFDPRDPDVVYAASYQRRRHVGILIGGGPESAIYKSTDGGMNWEKLTEGLPTVDIGRIALAVSPQNPDVVYALIAAADKESGFFRSADRGATWTRQSNYSVIDPQYYGQIYPDPHKFDRVYAEDMQIHFTEDGGKSFKTARWPIHVDHHTLEFDPTDENHLIVGNDGGLYETYDGGGAWRHFTNLPTYQIYRVGIDNALPFYNVYAGSQDNGTLGGPSRTQQRVGVRNSDWISTSGGDGMQPRADPKDPNIVYSMTQNGAIARMDKRTGERVGIQPEKPKEDEPPVRWHWDSPFIISPHAHKRLYFAGSRLYRSDDRGDNWQPISPDLTRGLDPAEIPVMRRIWEENAVQKNRFTTALSVATALAESSLSEGLLYVGMDDGLMQVSEDGGENWRKIERFPGAPEWTYVSDVCASLHDADTLYAAFNNYQRGDFKPYLMKSGDRGKTWKSIAGNLPNRHVVWTVVEDHVNENLLFAGTEFGLFFTVDGGERWVQLKGGTPTIAFRDLEIQRRESDLVAGTYGRGIYILDDYTVLRYLTKETLTREAWLFPPRNVRVYDELGYAPNVFGNYALPNPTFGAFLTYYLRGDIEGDEKGEVELTIADADGKTIREMSVPSTPGLHRVTWDLRSDTPPSKEKEDDKYPLDEEEEGFLSAERSELEGDAKDKPADRSKPEKKPPPRRRQPGPLVKPGLYTFTLNERVDDETTALGETQTIEVLPLSAVSLDGSKRDKGF